MACFTLAPPLRAHAQKPAASERSPAVAQNPSSAAEQLADRHLRLARALEGAGDTHGALRELRTAYALRDRPVRGLLLRARSSIDALRAHMRRLAPPDGAEARAPHAELRRAVSHVERALARALRATDEIDAEAPGSHGWVLDIPIEDEVLVPVAWRAEVDPPRMWAAYPVNELIVPADWSPAIPRWPSHPQERLLVPPGW